jgi:hypothetical protein
MDGGNLRTLEAAGVPIVSTTHLLSYVTKALKANGVFTALYLCVSCDSHPLSAR